MIARWWGGGRMSAVNRALQVVDVPLADVDVEGVRGLLRRDDVDALATASPEHPVRLLPGFDPFTNELPRRVESVLGDADHARVHRTAGWVTPIVVIDGRIAGTWEIEAGKGRVDRVVIRRIGRSKQGVRPDLDREVDRIAAFLDRPLRLEMAPAR
jgi:hypothetical protein